MARALDGRQAGELQRAFALLQAGQPGEALAVARRLVDIAACSADAQQLLGMCLSRGGQIEAALDAFARALELAPDHPLILSNYVLALRQAGRVRAALRLALRATEIASDSPKAWLELSVAAQAAGDPALAASAGARALRLQPDSLPALQAVGNAARAGEDLAAAEKAYRTLLARDASQHQAWLGLGDVQRRAGRPDLALATCEQALRQLGVSAELVDARTGAIVDAGRIEEALQLAASVVREHPGFATGWSTLADLAWEYAAPDQRDACLAAFAAAARSQPHNLPLRLAYARFLQNTGNVGEALAQLDALYAAQPSPSLLLMRAQAYDALGRDAQARDCYARLQHSGWHEEPSFLNAWARHLLRTGDFPAAAAAAEAATRIAPLDQQAWAWLATAWRLLGDEREHWLCDYDRLVGLVDVEPPPGFADDETFLQALSELLDTLHRARREPMQQSLRGGSQTPGRLFGRPDRLLEATWQSLLHGIERWLANLPEDPGHPFLSRRRRSVRLGGSWSVKLWSSGSHANHIHTDGWMSSAFYVSLPPSVQAAGSADTSPGAIQFGQPPRELGLGLPLRRVMAPRPGMLALFPSYLWHGTIPFHDQAPRVTIAFDMLPHMIPG